MYKIQEIQNCLIDWIKWRNQGVSDSGLYYDDFHPLLTTENLDAIAPEGVDLNDWLTEKTKAAITKLIGKVFIQKKLGQYTKDLFKEIRLYDGAGSLRNKVIKNGRFVGFELVLKRATNVIVNIDYIGWQFDTLQNPLTIYLYHSSQEDAIATIDLDVSKTISSQFQKISQTIEYFNGENNPGGSYYLGYYEDDLVGQAIQIEGDLSMPCGSCNRNSYENWHKWNEYVKVTPMFVNSSALNGIKLWDIENNNYDSTNFGLNLIMTASCDITDFICNHKEIWNDALGKNVAVDVLAEAAYSQRINRLKNVAQDLILMELNGDNDFAWNKGMKGEADKALKALDFDLSRLDSPCMPCQKKGIKMKGV